VPPIPVKFKVEGVTVIESIVVELPQPVNGRARPANNSVPKQNRSNIVGLLAFPAGWLKPIDDPAPQQFSRIWIEEVMLRKHSLRQIACQCKISADSTWFHVDPKAITHW
jgi:hypothetical protein